MTALPRASAQTSAGAGARSAPLGRRFLSLLYETLLLVAVLWCAALAFELLTESIGATRMRIVFQLYLFIVAGAYFTWQWSRGGQTLAMKTWRLRCVSADGRPVSVRQALLRYVSALVGAAVFGVGFLWAFVDRDRRFLHDRIAGTHLISVFPDA